MESRFHPHFLEQATEIMRAIGHPIRITMVDLLHEKGDLTVTQIHTELNIEQAIASHHLRILKDKGILFCRRSGKNTYYGLRVAEMSHFIQLLEKVDPARISSNRLVA